MYVTVSTSSMKAKNASQMRNVLNELRKGISSPMAVMPSEMERATDRNTMMMKGEAAIVRIYARLLFHSILLRSTFHIRLKDHSTRDSSHMTIQRKISEEIIP